jgi:hypothetical protein
MSMPVSFQITVPSIHVCPCLSRSKSQYPAKKGHACLIPNYSILNQKVLGRIPYFPSIRHGPHRKRCVQQFFYCCVRSRCRGNGFTELLPSNGRDTHTDTQRQQGSLISAFLFFQNMERRLKMSPAAWFQIIVPQKQGDDAYFLTTEP